MPSGVERRRQGTPAPKEFAVELRFIRYADFIVRPKNPRREFPILVRVPPEPDMGIAVVLLDLLGLKVGPLVLKILHHVYKVRERAVTLRYRGLFFLAISLNANCYSQSITLLRPAPHGIIGATLLL